MDTENKEKVSLACAVLTVSDSRTAGNDTSGNLLAHSLAHAGHQCVRRDIVPDNLYQIRRIVSEWIADPEVQVILTSGGTGFSPRNSTPEAIRVLFDKEIDGFGELFRQLSYAEIGSSTVQSRAIAGYANDTLIFCMPGSNSACQTAWDGIIREQLDSDQKPCNFATQFRRRDAEE
ncbi:molybdenum cofactor biosynthesis protein B [Bordetella genomosp. 1]|uniref:Molybdenum cofactor biosynthesis protein B n=1 Tax=Bordetella genomosp. 1 TaxID=1395607 RepID=A0A261RVJ3_9BORD|nr:molybdenum cofactor biosynthesis protein B [Bordetella genomosp. 1]OZI29106.1 molybdenum cofactor biosynthesis protein B [Bordetella genomosp. 1]OZI65157.1 molybdenum cofactor biosynthesis protein B [Bordetella genomosp. 1]